MIPFTFPCQIVFMTREVPCVRGKTPTFPGTGSGIVHAIPVRAVIFFLENRRNLVSIFP